MPNSIWTGFKLLRETGSGLLEAALSEDEQHLITEIFLPFINFHVLVPGEWTL